MDILISNIAIPTSISLFMISYRFFSNLFVSGEDFCQAFYHLASATVHLTSILIKNVNKLLWYLFCLHASQARIERAATLLRFNIYSYASRKPAGVPRKLDLRNLFS